MPEAAPLIHATCPFSLLATDAVPFGGEAFAVEKLGIEDTAGAASLGEIEHALTGGAADVAKELVRPGDAVRREDDVVEIGKAIRFGDGFFGEAIQGGAGDFVLF